MISRDNISDNGRRVARNTIFLYMRMLLLMIIGLFTSRVVLGALGEDNWGIYGAVGGVVMLLNFMMASISQAISRYIIVGISSGDSRKLRTIFSTSMVMQMLFCIVVLVLVETVGVWFLHNKMNVPPDRMDAAFWTLQCSMAVLMITLLSVPFNASIIAHEKMSAFAYISILEAVLKLAVALLLYISPVDKLISYSVLLVTVAIITRSAYGVYCRHNFEETRGKLAFDRHLIKELAGFAGWNLLGSGAYMFNTQGVTALISMFFNIRVNAARQAATQVEGIVKQFVTNILTALNPQIIKSHVSGEHEYCYGLVCKGTKYSYLVMLLFAIPFWFESDILLKLWLNNPPEMAAMFTKLTVIALMTDLTVNPLVTLIQANGKIKRYYITYSLVSMLTFVLSWIAFRTGYPAYVTYVIFIAVNAIIGIVRMVEAKRTAGFDIKGYTLDVLLRLAVVTLVSWAVTLLVWKAVPSGIARLLATVACSTISICATAWFAAFSPGERQFIIESIGRLFNGKKE